MDLHFLDAGFDIGYGGFILIFLVIPLGIILLEAGIMQWTKYNLVFGKCFLDSFLANLVTIIAGFILSEVGSNISIGGGNVPGILIAFLISVVLEALVLMFFNKKKPAKASWITSLVMNMCSYIALVLLTVIISL